MVTRDTINGVRRWGAEHGVMAPAFSYVQLSALCDLAEAALDAREALEIALDDAEYHAEASDESNAEHANHLRALLSHLSPPTHQDEERA